jgi:hypothetical protein
VDIKILLRKASIDPVSGCDFTQIKLPKRQPMIEFYLSLINIDESVNRRLGHPKRIPLLGLLI